MDIKGHDIVSACEKVINNCLVIVRAMSDILDINDKVSEEYGIDFFNECLPLNEYPFELSFDEMAAEIRNWMSIMVDLNEKEIGVIDYDNHN